MRPDHHYSALTLSIPGNECPEEKYLNRHVVKEIAAACAYQRDVWRDLGIELLGQGGIAELDVIKANNTDDVTKCCSKMLSLWLQRQIGASWNQLIEALVQVKLNRVAEEIRKGLKSPTDKQQGQTEKQSDLQVKVAMWVCFIYTKICDLHMFQGS